MRTPAPKSKTKPKPQPQRSAPPEGAARAAAAGPAVKQWTVTLAPGTDFAQATRALHAAGLTVTDALEVIGVVNGAAPQRLVARLRQVAGVADVSPLLGFDIGPPGTLEN